MRYDGRMGNQGFGKFTVWHRNWQTDRRLLTISLLVAICGCLGLGTAQALTIGSTVLEDNGATSNGLDGNQNLYSTPIAGNATITTAGGYDFTQTMYMTLTSITSITITLTVQDGNSEAAQPDGFDYNHLHLSLDGTATGLTLNGFRGDALQDTLTFTGTPTNAATVLASLQADGKLVGTITTDNPNDTITMPNEVYLGNDQNNVTTTLSITGVPEPGAWAGVGLGILLVTGLCKGKRRQLHLA